MSKVLTCGNPAPNYRDGQVIQQENCAGGQSGIRCFTACVCSGFRHMAGADLKPTPGAYSNEGPLPYSAEGGLPSVVFCGLWPATDPPSTSHPFRFGAGNRSIPE
jgi:hypothetical protein